MQRIVHLGEEFKTFEGKPIHLTSEKNSPAFTVKDGLLVYLRNASRMGLNDHEQSVAYVLGFIIGQGEGDVQVTTEQYDVLKKMTDKGKYTDQSGKEEFIYDNEIRLQMKEKIDKSGMVEEES